jgi:hypothetical protein
MAMELAHRGNVSELAVMQHMYDIKGSPGIDAQLAITFFDATGLFETIQYEFDKSTDNWKTVATAKEKATGTVHRGPEVSLQMAAEEGWSSKPGSKWKTLPELMLRYRSAVFLIRTVAPGALLGLYTREEVIEMVEVTPGVHEVEKETLTTELLKEEDFDEVHLDREVKKPDPGGEVEPRPGVKPGDIAEPVSIEEPAVVPTKWICTTCDKTFEQSAMVGEQCYKCHADASKVEPPPVEEVEVVKAEGPPPEDMAIIGEFRNLKSKGMTAYAESVTVEKWAEWSPFVQKEFRRLYKKKLETVFQEPTDEPKGTEPGEPERPDQKKFFDSFADEMNELRDRHFAQFGHENYYYEVLGRHGYENLIQVRQQKNEALATTILKEVESELDN